MKTSCPHCHGVFDDSRAGDAYLRDEQALAAIVMWSSGQFDTDSIAKALRCREDAVYRTLALAKEGARADRRAG
ncbi:MULTISPECIES: hypothetical protein [unclassified Mesorhizobium]|uniref:hypothetical protein n=1 Tax=unclassified Mesorhizobium TaxID=325217 RepID=UPI00112D1278|nr:MULTISPECIES: hypothetical protein [unclassified Mesorhizobium]TPK42285.1 hypothetical protein FJ550_30075 [Mesorhizobium sp. B2-5-2]TPL44520.1 hypothetical protein FJ961_04065 [Mesorhizobium sp. B2-4-5]TPM68707.1 hypothetical protein FJ968_29870 [Mesorhizobium sp. B2-1-6]TPN71733.1 hypothetical protein FJ985_30580 [Mesorhizobium sp. B1-1-2]